MLSRLTLPARVFLGTTAIVAAVLAVALAVASASVRGAGGEAARRGLEQAADLVAQFLAGRERSLAGGARVFVQGPYFRSLVAERRRDDILDQAFEAREQLDADWVFITDERGVLLAKSDEPGASGDQLGAIPLVNGALRGRVTTGFGVSRDTLLFQAVAVPIVIPGGAPVGVLVATKRVDSLLARDVNAATASEVVFYTLAGDRPLVAASTLGRGPDVSRALATLVGARGAAAESATRPDVVIGRTTFVEQGAALTTAGGEVVGGFIVLRSPDAELTGIAGVHRSLLAAGALGLLLAALASALAARRVARPLQALTDAARRAADGDQPADDANVAHGAALPEVAELRAALASVLADVRDRHALAMLDAPEPAAASAVGDAGVRPELRVAGGVARRAVRGAAPVAHGPRSDDEARAPDDAGRVIAGRYAVERTLGGGATGTVYAATDRVRHERVAVKLLRPEAVATDAASLGRMTDALARTRRAAHRNVACAHELGESDGVPFVVSELVDGPSLAAVLRAHGPLPLPVVVAIARQLLRALEVAHAHGLVHGDVKPANVLLARDGVLKVTDFGVARLLRRPAARGALAPDVAGAVVGTPEYMAPELLLGAGPDVGTDVYAAGMVLHECLTGATPFQAEAPVAFLARKLDDAEPPRAAASTRRDRPQERAAVRALEELVARMTAHDPAARPASAGEVRAALTSLG